MKRINRIVIVANGNISEILLSRIQNADYVIGVDRAAYVLLKHGIIPDVSIGDFDSVTQKEVDEIKKYSKQTIEFPVKKDSTDLELAINHAISLHPHEVLIFGAIGTRLDHSFVALQLLEKFVGSGISAVIRNEKNECALCTFKYIFERNDSFKYFSILPVTDTIYVTITGGLYPLKHALIQRGSSLGISNEIVSKKVSIMVHKGVAMIIRSSD
jgi:thiamine pyrophosphokinase